MAIDQELDLLPQPAAQIQRLAQLHMKIGKVGIDEKWMLRVQPVQRLRYIGQRRTNPGDQLAGLQGQPPAAEQRRDFCQR